MMLRLFYLKTITINKNIILKFKFCFHKRSKIYLKRDFSVILHKISVKNSTNRILKMVEKVKIL